MPKLAIKIAIPIILVGIFAIIAFISIDYEQWKPSFYVIISLLVIFVFFSGIAIGQNFSSRIKKILDKAEELNKGNLSSRVYLETKDELSELAKSFNKLAENLEESRLQEENAEKTIAIKVKARTDDLEETINALEQKVKNRTIELEKLIQKANKIQENSKGAMAELTPPKK